MVDHEAGCRSAKDASSAVLDPSRTRDAILAANTRFAGVGVGARTIVSATKDSGRQGVAPRARRNILRWCGALKATRCKRERDDGNTAGTRGQGAKEWLQMHGHERCYGGHVARLPDRRIGGGAENAGKAGNQREDERTQHCKAGHHGPGKATKRQERERVKGDDGEQQAVPLARGDLAGSKPQ